MLLHYNYLFYNDTGRCSHKYLLFQLQKYILVEIKIIEFLTNMKSRLS